MEIWRGIINLLNGRKGLWALALSGLWSLGIKNSTTFQLFGRRICARIIVSFWNLSKTNLKECQSVNERNLKPMMPNCLCKKGKEGQLE
ncbi:unnamed protein product [Rhizophagus irregularis]|nr:unnamed protein product [Rhizophagus irregularis]